MGTVGIVAAIVPVSDLITLGHAPLHRSVAGGAGFPAALQPARADAAEDRRPG